MAAHEQQNECVVLFTGMLRINWWRYWIELHGRCGFAAATSRFTSYLIRQATDGDLNEPAARIFGQAFARPLQRGGDQRLLDSVLGGRKIMKAPNDRTEHPGRKLVQQMLGFGA